MSFKARIHYQLLFFITIAVSFLSMQSVCRAEPISTMCDGIRGWYKLGDSDRSAKWNAALSLDSTRTQVSEYEINSAVNFLQSDLDITNSLQSPTDESAFLQKWKSQSFKLPIVGFNTTWSLPKLVYIHTNQLSMSCGLSCYKAIEALNDETQIRWVDEGLTLLPHVVWNFAADKSLQRAVRQSVAIMGAKLKAVGQNISQVDDLGNFFDDLIAGGKAEGMTDQQAEDFAWKATAIYGANATETYPLSSTLGKASYHYFNSLISLAVYMQSLTKGGHQYLLPKTVQSTCALGKEYHFWLAAYLTHTLMAQGFSFADTCKAVYAYSSLYEFASPTNGRDNSLEEFAYGFPRSGFIQSVRLDLAYDAAGIQYGSANFNVNLNSIIGSFYETAPERSIDWSKHPLLFQLDMSYAEIDDYLKVAEPELIFSQIAGTKK